MILRLLIFTLGLVPLLSVAQTSDLLRFDNGDQLHGEFNGFTDGAAILWKRDNPKEEAMNYDISDIRQVVLRGSKPGKSLQSLSYVGTANGDRIPGIVQGLDDQRVMVQTEFGGLLEFPKDQIGIIAPNPMGGRVLYHGPFDKEEWVQKSYKHADGIPMNKKESEIEKEFPLWKFSGSGWYWNDERVGTALTRDTGMPDRSILQFDLAWKNRLSLAVGFHSDFKIPKNAQALQEQTQRPNFLGNLPYILGSSYVLHIYSSYVVLYRSGFSEDGKPTMDRLQSRNSSLRLENSGSAKIEIRCNRISGEIMLYVDGKFVSQWDEKPENLTDEVTDSDEYYIGKGEGYGFMVQMEQSPVRVSDIVVAEWNGIPDSARSLESDDTDIVLLTNGTDRFSGKITSVKDSKLTLSGRYGNFSFPMTEIAEIRFAKSQVKTINQDDQSSEFKIRFHPFGSISGQVVSGDSKKVRIMNAASGEINVDLNSATMLEFKSTQSYLDDWNVEF